ncbi:MAG TPA: DUF721 domain-containing protein [bacterium]|nr:DUF721 domain-containing protein [bacterium]
MLTALRQLLRGAARALGVERAAYTALIEDLWPAVVGPEAAAHSHPVDLRGGVLIAAVDPGLWSQELSARRGGFVAEINRRLGAGVVTEIRFTPRPRPSGAPLPAAPAPPGGADPAAGEATADELAAVERIVAEISDPEVREAARRAMRSQVAWRKRHVPPPGG